MVLESGFNKRVYGNLRANFVEKESKVLQAFRQKWKDELLLEIHHFRRIFDALRCNKPCCRA